MSEQPDSLWSGSYLNAATSRMIEGQIPFPHPSSHSLSVSISRTTKVVVFICSMFHPQSVIICPQLSSQEKDAEWTFISITGKVDPGKRGDSFQSFSLTWLFSGSAYPSITASPPSPKSTLLFLHLAAFHPSFLYVLLSLILLTLITAAFTLFMCLAQVKSIYPTWRWVKQGFTWTSVQLIDN